jgi:hypothetical protein
MNENMKQHTNEERFAGLNRHGETLHIDKETAFTVLTQHFKYKNIEEICDIIINYENFNKIYGYDICCYEQNTSLYIKRKEIFFSENRILTDEETECCIKHDDEYQTFINGNKIK